MKKIDNKVKIFLIVSVAILLVGIIMIAALGFNFDLRYQAVKKVELNINKEFEISDVKQITDEVFDKQEVLIQKVEVFDDSISIIAKDITDEQKTNLITKVNEKYGTELSADSVEIQSVPHTRGRDLVKPYIMPLVISTLIILVYISIRYYKLGLIEVLLKTVIVIDYAQAMLFSIIAITRLPVGRITMPMIIVVYLLTLVALTTKFEEKLKKIKLEEKNK